MKYLPEDRLNYFRTYLGQPVLVLDDSEFLYPVTEKTLTIIGDDSYLSLRSVETLSDEEALLFYKEFSSGATTTPKNCRVWANSIAGDLSAPSFDDGYQHLISKGFLVPFESRSIKLLQNLGWAKERQISADQ